MAERLPKATQLTDEQKDELRQKRSEQRKEKEVEERKAREVNQLQDVIDGIGFSTDKTLARYFDTTRKTIWDWSRNSDNAFPKPKKIGPNLTRWSNAELKIYREKHFLGKLYG